MKRRTESVVDDPSPGPTSSRLIGEGDWQDVVKAAIYQPRPIAGFPKSTKKKTTPKK